MWFALIFLIHGISAHMGITNIKSGAVTVQPRDLAKGDNYRNPNSGHCHGVAPGPVKGTFNVGDTVTLTLSGGAAHNGGACALFLTNKADEKLWYKQKDIESCSLKKSFNWEIKKELVPQICENGCTLIWVWSPRSSGTCEVYINCFDIAIKGAGSGSKVTVTKGFQCVRVANAPPMATPMFGDECGFGANDDCLGKGTGTYTPTAASGASVTPSPTATPIVKPHRCGKTWTDANVNCGAQKCLKDADCTTSGEGCYADMVRTCSTATLAPTSSGSGNTPTATPIVASKCRATTLFSGVNGMDNWCAKNCPDVCPGSHCICTDSTAQILDPNVKAYVPQCKIHDTDGAQGLDNIATIFDLASYANGGSTLDEKTAVATNALYEYNKLCNPNLEGKSGNTWPKIPANTRIYITGDCQLTKACQKASPSAACQKSSIITVVLITIFGVLRNVK